MDLCRTCGQSKFLETLCNIKDPELMIESKLKEAFNVQLAPDQVLPQQICFQCVSKVESSFDFYNKVKETQANLFSNLSVQFCDPALVKQEMVEDDEDYENFPTELLQPVTNVSVKKEPVCQKPALFSSKHENSLKTRQNKQEKQIRRHSRPKHHNIKLKIEDIFVNELAGVYDGPTDMLNVDESEKNADGSLSESALERLQGWTYYEWKCVICSNDDEKICLDSLESLETHFSTEHKDSKIVYPCNDCLLSFKSYFIFRNHVTDHHPHLKFCCEFCNIYRWNLVDLYKHRQEHHPKFKNTCLYCGHVFLYGFYLKQHVGIHQKWKPEEHFYCDLCPYECHTKSLIKQHITYIHGKGQYKESVCDQCGKICKRDSQMKTHLLKHTNERPFGCDVCKLKFKSFVDLQRHRQSHFQSKIQCEVCGKKFLTKAFLIRHSRIHLDIFPFTCEFCGKKFKHQTGFNTHRRIHTGERPYLCPFEGCGQKFIDWANMNKHSKAKHALDNSTRKQKIYLD